MGDFSSEKVVSAAVGVGFEFAPAEAEAEAVVAGLALLALASSLAAPAADDVGKDVEDADEGDDDLALEGTKGTEAGFKLDLMADAAGGCKAADADFPAIGAASFNFCNAFVAAACLAA